MRVQIERFHLNGHAIGFRPQTQKLELPNKTPLFTLAVKGLSNHLSSFPFTEVGMDAKLTKSIAKDVRKRVRTARTPVPEV